jgi:hypothetical protein
MTQNIVEFTLFVVMLIGFMVIVGIELNRLQKTIKQLLIKNEEQRRIIFIMDTHECNERKALEIIKERGQ